MHRAAAPATAAALAAEQLGHDRVWARCRAPARGRASGRWRSGSRRRAAPARRRRSSPPRRSPGAGSRRPWPWCTSRPRAPRSGGSASSWPAIRARSRAREASAASRSWRSLACGGLVGHLPAGHDSAWLRGARRLRRLHVCAWRQAAMNSSASSAARSVRIWRSTRARGLGRQVPEQHHLAGVDLHHLQVVHPRRAGQQGLHAAARAVDQLVGAVGPHPAAPQRRRLLGGLRALEHLPSPTSTAGSSVTPARWALAVARGQRVRAPSAARRARSTAAGCISHAAAAITTLSGSDRSRPAANAWRNAASENATPRPICLRVGGHAHGQARVRRPGRRPADRLQALRAGAALDLARWMSRSLGAAKGVQGRRPRAGRRAAPAPTRAPRPARR